jgi:hypothetical protein
MIRILGKRPSRTLVIAAAALVGAIIVGFSSVTLALADRHLELQSQPPATEALTDWPTNANGLTYGSALFATSPQDEPDLIAALATNGKVGYVYKSDLDGPAPSTPQEALSLQAASAGKTRVIPVYEVDGSTVIGEFLTEPTEGQLMAPSISD